MSLWDPAKHPRGAGGRFGNTVGAMHLKAHNVAGTDAIAVLSTRVKKYAGFETVLDFIEKHPKGKAAALRILAADHKAGKIAFKAATKTSPVAADHAIEVLSKTTKKYAGHATVASFIASHPKGKTAAMRILAADQKAGRIALKVAPKAAGTSDDPIDAAGWKKVGKQKGSNPGGTYEAQDGKQFYLKEGKSKAHVENELLASALYKKLGVTTLDPKAFKLDGKLAVGSEIQAVGKFDSNLAAHVALAQKDFAAHAYLANWDAVGASYDNVGIIDGKVAQLDGGGALKFRAQGAQKPKFDGSVTEFNSLRSSSVNHQTEKIFGSMTAAQLEASAKPVLKLTDKDIDDVVKATISSPAERASLAKTLKARRDDLGKRVEAEKLKEKAEKTAIGTLHADEKTRWTKAAGVRKWMNRHPNSEDVELLTAAYQKTGVAFTSNAESKAADYYTHAGYSALNHRLREGKPLNPEMKQHSAELDNLIAESRFKQDTIMYRGYGAAADLQNKAPPPGEHDDKGFVSVSFNPGVARSFSDGKSIYRVRIPKGFPGRAVSISGSTSDAMVKNEAEVILPRGTQFRIVKRSKKEAFSGSIDVIDVVAYLPKKKA